MALIYVTGTTAAGKSSVRNELVRRGFVAHDGDAGNLAAWVDREHLRIVAYPDRDERPADWLDRHAYKLSRERVEQLAAEATTKLVFLCGIASNDLEPDLFAAIVCLTLDEATLRHRIATRTTNHFGKAPDELAQVLNYFEPAQEAHRRLGSFMVDARRPLGRVVDDIVAIGESAS